MKLLRFSLTRILLVLLLSQCSLSGIGQGRRVIHPSTHEPVGREDPNTTVNRGDPKVIQEAERKERESQIREYEKNYPDHKLLEAYEIQGMRGYALCGAPTSDITKATLYITPTDLGSLYVHSNFLDLDSKKDVAKADVWESDGKTFFDVIVQQIFIQDRVSEQPFFEQRKRQFEKEVKLIIDPAIFNDPTYKTLGLDHVDPGNIKVYCPDGITRNIHKLANDEYVIDYAEKIKTRIGKVPEVTLSFLNEQFPYQENYKVLSLVEDRMTNNKLNKLFSQHKLSLDYKRTQEQLKEDLMAVLMANKNNLVHILGHIEENSFVTKNAAKEVIFSIPVSDINEFQKNNRLPIIFNGCSSALRGAGTGHTVTIDSKESLDRIALAHENKKKTNAEFFSDLAPANGYMVIGNDIVNGFATIKSEIYSKKTDEPLMAASLVSAIPYRSISTDEPPPGPQPDHVTFWGVISAVLGTIIPLFAILFGCIYLYDKLFPIKPTKK